jgi:hypothetical protein
MRRQFRRFLGALSFTAALFGVSGHAHAAPIEASGIASADAGQADRARDRAISTARQAALEQAIATLDMPLDPEAVKQVLARADAWTAAYRVLEIRNDGASVEVRVEVEIDLPRLRKRVAEQGNTPSRAGFRWGALRPSGCPTLAETTVTDPLRTYGILTSAGETTLSLALSCSDRGAVTHTHVRAAAVELVATTTGAVELELRVSAQGFAEDVAAATQIALDRAVAELADALAVEARGDLELRVEQPWPAARITTLERSLREAVLGVNAVELAGITADGSVVLRVAGTLDAAGLARRLQDQRFPGFGLVGLRIDGAHALRVRMQ